MAESSSALISRAMIVEYDAAVAQLAARAEDLTDLDGTFVETVFPEMMQARQHQIIYGRRGAGKTHLLRHVESALRKGFPESDILPIYVNGGQLSRTVSIISSDPPMMALAIYVELLTHVMTQIRQFVATLKQANFWDHVAGGGKSQAARKADEIVAMLEGALTSGQARLLPTGEVSDEATTLLETSRNSSADASIKVDPQSLGWALKAGTSAERSAKTSSVTTRKIRGEVILPFSQVSSCIRQLLELLGNASIYLLFDEWSEVDKDRRVQPYLAEMLGRTASSVPGMYLKLACIPGRTVLATPITEGVTNPIGLEEGDDIHTGVNLDEIVFSGESITQLVPFYIAMVKKHVGERVAWVRDASSAYFESFLTSMVFSGMKPFMELCQAAGGVPRDFISIYKAATVDAAMVAGSGQHREPFELLAVRIAAKRVYHSKRISFERSTSPQLQLLDRIYQEIYIKKHSYQFLLSEESAEDDVVQTLYMVKLIHRLPASYYNPDDERRYQYFQLDYGTTIDRLMANAVDDVRASYQSSRWIMPPLSRGKFLAGSSDGDISKRRTLEIAAVFTALLAEPGRLDIEPREIIFRTSPPARTVRPRASRGRGKHRRRN